MNYHRRFVFTGLFLLADLLELHAQNREFEALQAHLERVISARSNALFSGIRSVAAFRATFFAIQSPFAEISPGPSCPCASRRPA